MKRKSIRTERQNAHAARRILNHTTTEKNAALANAVLDLLARLRVESGRAVA